jgi:uncharacterized membrane protein
MRTSIKRTRQCQVCGERKSEIDLIHGDHIREVLKPTIRTDFPNWDDNGFICLKDLNQYRTRHIQEVFETERGEVSELEAKVFRNIREQEVLANDTNQKFDQSLTIGARIADRVAEVGGSWTFIIGFLCCLCIWMFVNSQMLASLLGTKVEVFDPFPFIFLNLLLGALASLQAPFIMMSQSRQEARDRLRSENDYAVNLKAELEIRNLTAKLDQLMSHQWRHLLEIQQIQTDMMTEFSKKAIEKGGKDE